MAAHYPAKRTAAQTPQQRYRTNDRRAGVIQLNVRVQEEQAARIKKFVTGLREKDKPSDAFAKAFPASAKAIAKRHAAKLLRLRG
ncbi:hypothetical protein [Rhodopila sp.]|uniref:hypothetical protein n=1 Tax=Rhodopila sp. TaxID=2480087 RepID=UPI003D0FA7D3